MVDQINQPIKEDGQWWIIAADASSALLWGTTVPLYNTRLLFLFFLKMEMEN
jgi:hypothetical protein